MLTEATCTIVASAAMKAAGRVERIMVAGVGVLWRCVVCNEAAQLQRFPRHGLLAIVERGGRAALY